MRLPAISFASTPEVRVILKRLGHFPHREEARAVAKLLRGYIRKHS